ncbi:bifunctional Translation initiation factor 2A/Translation initiation factor [Babesia duncani]|uniref:Bifunctional Translation initiation factor 2A/Translation initiation factor n=1 Tax=Babesia duncani TaxID=323732 RepID=A0AAD9UN58_9APIC|nr:bifunctional Translation initiation factor 2A/Translation initiation factor [Babesia duncani]
MAGFGNLSGDIDIWDFKTKTKIAMCKSSCSVTCDFAPDGRYFVTATTVPRMRVDCGFSIYSYSGKRVARIDYDVLYHVHIKAPKAIFKERDPSPHVCIMPQQQSSAIYKPPGSKGTAHRPLHEPQVVVAVAVAPKSKAIPKGPPGADATLLSAAAKIGQRKNKHK